jgi:hypothetical protein
MTQAHDPGTDAIRLLQRDHDEIRRLLSELVAAPPGPDLAEQLAGRIAGATDRIRAALKGRSGT